MSASAVMGPFSCADCGADDAPWASINRGVLVCNDCIVVHINLGRTLSMVRSLKRGIWTTSELDLVYALYSNGANSIWEHALLDPSTSATVAEKFGRKPRPSEPVFPFKDRFIRAKYEQSAFTRRDPTGTAADLNNQLYWCVRSDRVETTLRLLEMGADPNCREPSQFNTPLHMAAKEGQRTQVELLFLYGADVMATNKAGQTAAAVAKLEGHQDLANRLDELRFEITNRVSLFLVGARPNHKQGQNFLVPQLSERREDQPLEPLHALQSLDDIQFQAYCRDLYDEVERRDTLSAWYATVGSNDTAGANRCVGLFLPVGSFCAAPFVDSFMRLISAFNAICLQPNAHYSAVRNQFRQKLALLNDKGFTMVLVDMVNEARRRFRGEPATSTVVSPAPVHRANSDVASPFSLNTSAASALMPSFVSGDGNRDYDEVADYAVVASGVFSPEPRRQQRVTSDQPNGWKLDYDAYLEMKERLDEFEQRSRGVEAKNDQLYKNMAILQRAFDSMTAENEYLRHEVSQLREKLKVAQRPPIVFHHPNSPFSSVAGGTSPGTDAKPPTQFRPVVTEDGRARGGSISQDEGDRPWVRPAPSPTHVPRANGRQSADPYLHMERQPSEGRKPESREREREIRVVQEGGPSRVVRHASLTSPNGRTNGRHDDQRRAEVIKYENELLRVEQILEEESERVTAAIRHLHQDAKARNLRDAPEHAHRIGVNIQRLLSAIPPPMLSQREYQDIANQMVACCARLSARCNAPLPDPADVCLAAKELTCQAMNLLRFARNFTASRRHH